MADPPPAKRLKLKLKGPRPLIRHGNDSDEDTITVARPRRPSSLKKSSAVVDATSSELVNRSNDSASDISSVPPSPEPIVIAPTLDGTSRKTDYGDFMSYYIDDGSDEKHNQEVNIVAKPTSPVLPKQAAPARKSTSTVSKVTQEPLPSKILDEDARHGRQPTAAHDPFPPAMTGPLPNVAPRPQHALAGASSHPPGRHDPHPQAISQNQPPVQVLPRRLINVPIPYVPPPKTDLPPVPEPVSAAGVEEKLRSLHELSTALELFNGAPVTEPPFSTIVKPAAPKRNPLDPFLAAFEGNEGESRASEGDIAAENSIKQRLMGAFDHTLAYGMLFICNALHSWASKRIHYTYTMFLHQHLIVVADIEASQQRGRGRPKKDSRLKLPSPPLPPSFDERGQYHLNGTPEGRAIDAFYAVFRSGALQINTVLDASLAAALRNVYKQVNLLINQDGQDHESRTEPHKYISYWVQIRAHEELIAEARARDIAMRMQLENEEHFRRAMGVPPHALLNRPYGWSPATGVLPGMIGAQTHVGQQGNNPLLPHAGSLPRAGIPYPGSMEAIPHPSGPVMQPGYDSVANQPPSLRGAYAFDSGQQETLPSKPADDPIYISSSPRANPQGMSAPLAGRVDHSVTIEKPSVRKKGISTSRPTSLRKSGPGIHSIHTAEPPHTASTLRSSAFVNEAVTDTRRNIASRKGHVPASVGRPKSGSLRKKAKLDMRQSEPKDVIELSSGS